MAVAQLVLVMLVTACSADPRDDPQVAARLDLDGVTVVLRWHTGAAHRADSLPTATLTATLTPDTAGFHLYGQSLPQDGVDGIGRPTRLDVGLGLAADGSVTADRQERLDVVAGTHRLVPVYPAGPVTLSVPVRVTPGRPLRAWLSWAACSEQVCLAPVIRQPVDLPLPAARL